MEQTTSGADCSEHRSYNEGPGELTDTESVGVQFEKKKHCIFIKNVELVDKKV